MSTGKREFKLKKSKDWNAWLSVIKGKAVGYQIWEIIDPSLTIKSACLQKPQDIQKPDANTIETDPNVYMRYKIERTAYRNDFTKWNQQHEGLSKIIDLIYDTMSIINLTYIQKMEVHFWSLLRVLKTRLAPSNSARSLKFERDYERLKKGPSNKQDIEAWLNDYIQMYILIKKHDIAEIANTKRAYKNFLLIIESQASIFAQMHEYLINTTENKEKLLFKMIEKFRTHIRLRNIKKLTKNTADNFVFSILFTQSDSSNKFTFRDNSVKFDSCFCDQTHWWSDCYYLNEKIRSSD